MELVYEEKSGPHCSEKRPAMLQHSKGTILSKLRPSLESMVRWMIVMPREMCLPRFKRLGGMTKVKGHTCFISGRAEEQ